METFAAKVCSAKVCSAKVCSAKVCLAKVCSAKVCLAKVCLAKVCSAKVCSANKKKQFTLHTGSIGHQKVVTRNATAICSKLASATQASKNELGLKISIYAHLCVRFESIYKLPTQGKGTKKCPMCGLGTNILNCDALSTKK